MMNNCTDESALAGFSSRMQLQQHIIEKHKRDLSVPYSMLDLSPKLNYLCSNCGVSSIEKNAAYDHVVRTGHPHFWFHPDVEAELDRDVIWEDSSRDVTKTVQQSASMINNMPNPKPAQSKKRESSIERKRFEYEQHEEERRLRKYREVQPSAPDTPSAFSSAAEKEPKNLIRTRKSYSSEEWRKHRPLITEMYLEKGHTLENIREHFAREFNFTSR
jgi:hypothetical protein